MTKTSSIGRVYVSRTIFKTLKKYIVEDQRKLDRRAQLLNRLNNAIEMRGITHRDLASRLGKRASEIKKLLKGDIDFSAEILSKVESELAIRLTEV